jgi:hypothetical protein
MHHQASWRVLTVAEQTRGTIPSRANHRRGPAPTSCRTYELPNIVYEPGDQVSMVESSKHRGTARQEGRSERNLSAKRIESGPLSAKENDRPQRAGRSAFGLTTATSLCERARGESIDSRLFLFTKEPAIYCYPAPGSIDVRIAPSWRSCG